MTFVLVYSTVVCITAWHHIMTSLRHNLKSTVQTSEVFALNSLQTFLQFCDFFTVASASVERCHSRSTDANTKKRSVVWSRRLAYFHWCRLPTFVHIYIYRDLQLDNPNGAIHIDLDILRSILNHPERLYSRLKYLSIFTFFSFFACDNTTFWFYAKQSNKFKWPGASGVCLLIFKYFIV